MILRYFDISCAPAAPIKLGWQMQPHRFPPGTLAEPDDPVQNLIAANQQ
jgi:hypothetical protein